MILLDENYNAPLCLWFTRLQRVYWQSLLSNSVLPSYFVQKKQNTNFLTHLKLAISIDKTPLSKYITTSSTDCYNAIFQLASNPLKHSIISCVGFAMSSTQLSITPYSHQNTFRSNPRAETSFIYHKHTDFKSYFLIYA